MSAQRRIQINGIGFLAEEGYRIRRIDEEEENFHCGEKWA